MASISQSLRTIKAQLSKYVDGQQVEQIALRCGHRWKQSDRKPLGPAMTVHLTLLQLLAAVSLHGLRHVSQVAVSAAAVCKAKQRLPLTVWRELLGALSGGGKAVRRFCGHRLFLVDGTTALAQDTPKLARRYGKAANQKAGKPGYPVVKMLCLMDAISGIIAHVIPLPCARHEATVLGRIFRFLRPGDLLLGDRGLLSFAHIALLLGRGVQGCWRLPRSLVVRGRGKGRLRRVRRLGRQDLLVKWLKPLQYKLGWMSRRRWQKLPESLELRQIAVRLRRPGFRDQWAWVITTLRDPKLYPAQQIAELYGRRWQIEVNFRDLKRTLKMTQFSAKGPQGMHKEMLALVLLYNLVRQLMQEAAQNQEQEPDRISFIDALRWLLWGDGEELPELVVNPRRRRASEPRARKHGGYCYPVMQKPRADLQRPRAKVIVPGGLS